MQDAWRAYLELALGLTEASKKHAQAVARRVIGQSGATAAQLQVMAEDLFSIGMTNREALHRMIRAEVTRTLTAVGLATVEETAELRKRIDELEQQLRRVQPPPDDTPDGGPVQPAAITPTAGGRPGPGAIVPSVAKKTVAKKAVAKKQPPAAS